MTASLLTVITPSYRNDYELVVDLCASMDQFLEAPFKHLLLVPTSDMALFAPLASAHRVLMAKEDFLRQYGFHKLPFPKRIWIPGLVDIRTREQWYCRGAGRVSGWLVQQLIKLSAPALTDAEDIMFIDSDNILFRPLTRAHLYQQGAVKLARRSMRPDMHEHKLWHRNSLDLLGVPEFHDEQFNYIGHMIVWKRDAILALQQRIEQVTGMDWRLALSRKKDVSEYILYGVYCETVGKDRGHHVFTEPDMTCSFWTNDVEFNAAEMAKSLLPSHVALHIQSTIPMPMEKRRALIDELTARPAH